MSSFDIVSLPCNNYVPGSMWTLWICLPSTQVENWQMHKHWIFTFSYTHKDKHLHTTTQHWVHVVALINVCPLQAHRQTVSSHYLTIWSWRHLHVSSGEKKKRKHRCTNWTENDLTLWLWMLLSHSVCGVCLLSNIHHWRYSLSIITF